jgi:hypothetical protein
MLALLLPVLFISQGTLALAGTTGGLSGTVTDTSGKPIAGATVKAVSASQIANTVTDAGGHFNFLSLQPDTYTLQIHKDNFRDISEAGVSIFADQTQTLTFQMQSALKTIATVTSTAAGALVKSGVGQDVYSVSSGQIAASSSLGGGGNLNSAYSAIASVPGVNVPIGGAGWGQDVYIRGSQSFFTSFEYDGVPVNRAFDNYNSSTESNLGLQELQVYTGGGPASNSSSGTSGFINQVIKTGTYPGYGTLTGGVATDAFYHQAKVEVGGATPDRNFSYYAGISGYNQAYRYVDNNMGASLMGPGGIFSSYGYYQDFFSPVLSFNTLVEGPQVACQPGTGTPVGSTTAYPAPQGCLVPYFGFVGSANTISDRENVVNFHFGVPRKNGMRDDLQLLYSASSLRTNFYGGASDLGPTNSLGPNNGANLLGLLTTGCPSALTGCTTVVPGASYVDAPVYNAPFGTNVANLPISEYYQPSSPTNRAPGSTIPYLHEDGVFNDTGIVKLQYTHELSQNAYIRAFGYTFFSDWTQAGAIDAAGYFTGYGTAVSPNYDLITHTAGGEIQLADQINQQNLLNITGNYTSANVVRDNNTGFLNGGEPVGLISQSNGVYTCYNKTTGAVVPCYSSSYKTSSAAIASGSFTPTAPAACAPTCQFDTLWNGNSSGTYNTVGPRFTTLSVQDDWRPSDKLLISGGLRYENYTYNLQSSNTPANNFYAQIVSNYTCWNPQFGVATTPLPPGVPPPAPLQYVSGNCNAGLTADGVNIPNGVTYVHPNGDATQTSSFAVPNFTASSPSKYSQGFYSARVSGTYTQNPDTVWRVSAGRYTSPPISASVQYLYNSGAANTLWGNFENLGFFSPFHNIPSQSSAQYDLSLEKHIRGTDMSFKITPFYNYTNGYQGDAFIGQGFVTQVPIGVFRSQGVELGFQKGDFNRNGLSGQVSLAYTDAKMQYKSEFNGDLPNGITSINNAITQFNALTKSGGGSQCYAPAAPGVPGAAVSCSSPTAIVNPYYNMNSQGLLDPNGWYPAATYSLQPGVNTSPGYYDSPWVGSVILNYRKDKFAITPSVQFTEGTSYGTPYDVIGYDPRECGNNSANAAVPIVTPGTNPQQCDYTSLAGTSASPIGYLYIPNPQTGSFAGMGTYREPSIVTANLQMSYQVSPRISAQLTLSNIAHTCFGGSKEPWTSAYPAGGDVCGYTPNGFYVSNFQNGAGQLTPGNPASYDATANGGVTPYNWELQSYKPATGSPAANGAAGAQLPFPFNAYFTVQIRL